MVSQYKTSQREDTTSKQYETVIGLEVHIELSTATKLFCRCANHFGREANIHICPICMGFPGTLPILNEKVVEYAVAVGLATNCKINKSSTFDRKNYFYPDNPQNYQITQLYHPICYNGKLEIRNEGVVKVIRIHNIHIEEDAGKLIHNTKRAITSIDYNRAGVPLLEMVTEPDFTTSEEVLAFLEELKSRLHYLEVSDCKLEEGSMRVDVNLSLKKIIANELDVKFVVFLLNLSPLRFL